MKIKEFADFFFPSSVARISVEVYDKKNSKILF